MRTRITVAVLTALTTLALVLPAIAGAADESGSTTKWPWTGYWWPMRITDTNLYDEGGPLQKYDQYLKNTTGTAGTAQTWERANHATEIATNSWWGHCHAWSAASVVTAEPPSAITKGGVTFSSNDTRGLVTELYYSPKLTWLSGVRVDKADDKTSAAYKDIAPAWMDYLLRYYIRYNKYSFVMDINADSEVWNFPAFAYSRNTTAYDGGWQYVRTTVWFSSPTYGATGTKYFSRNYTYWLKDGTLGEWTGASVDNHPDFAWVPTGKNAMPHVKESVVEQILGQDV